MPRGAIPSEKITAKQKRAIKKLGEIPQGYTMSPEPKNKFKTVVMPKDLKEKAKKNTETLSQIMKARINEAARVKEARKKKK